MLMTKSLYLSKISKNMYDAAKSCKALRMSLLAFENEDHYKNFMKSIESVEPRIENAYTAYKYMIVKWTNVDDYKDIEIPLIFHEPPKWRSFDDIARALAIAYKNDVYKMSDVAFTMHYPFICQLIQPSLNNSSTLNIVLFIFILLLLCVIFIFAFKKYVNKNATSVTPAVVEEQP